MLINTVVLFLRDTLPIFLLISVLLTLPAVSRVSLTWRLTVLVVLAYITYLWLGDISQLAQGAGFELLKTGLLITAWIGTCLLAVTPLPSSAWFKLAVSLVLLGICLPNSLHFMVYFISELSRHTQPSLLIMGTTIGLGISVSIAILLNIAITALLNVKATYQFIILFVAAQVSNVTLLLEQIDVFPTPYQVWDSSMLVTDNSEYGHLLNALIGYEATPSLSYLLVFFITLIIPLLLHLKQHAHNPQVDHKELP